MSEKERIERLEQMLKTVAETVSRITTIINTGSYEYSLSDVLAELRSVKEFKSE